MAGEITQLLVRWSSGERAALDELTPLVYNELRQLAGKYLHHWGPQHSLQPTMLVHEAWLRLVGHETADWEDRAQFFGLAAIAMRHFLVDHAREQQAAKRGGTELLLSLSAADRIGQTPDIDLLALDEALNRMALLKPRYARIVELRFFGGLTIEETAKVLDIAHATVEREWAFAKTWLHREMSR